MIGGNIDAILQTKKSKKNAIGGYDTEWVDLATLHGWLDLSTGDASHTTFNAKIQESTHIFLCDAKAFHAVEEKFGKIKSENSRLLINGLDYEVTVIDDPMNLKDHMEIFLNYVGGQ